MSIKDTKHMYKSNEDPPRLRVQFMVPESGKHKYKVMQKSKN